MYVYFVLFLHVQYYPSVFYPCLYMYSMFYPVYVLLLTSVVQDVLYDVLDLLKAQVVLWSLACVPVYSRNWTVFQVAGLDVLESLQANGVHKQKGALTHTVSLVKKLAIHCLSVCRRIAVMTDECCRLEGVSHDVSHH